HYRGQGQHPHDNFGQGAYQDGRERFDQSDRYGPPRGHEGFADDRRGPGGRPGQANGYGPPGRDRPGRQHPGAEPNGDGRFGGWEGDARGPRGAERYDSGRSDSAPRGRDGYGGNGGNGHGAAASYGRDDQGQGAGYGGGSGPAQGRPGEPFYAGSGQAADVH